MADFSGSKDDAERDWLRKAFDLAMSEGLECELDEHYNMLSFGNHDIRILFKKVECLVGIRDVHSLGGEFLEIWIENLLGYGSPGGYDGYIKNEKTPKEAVAEVKSLLPRIDAIKEQLNDLLRIYEELAKIMEK